MYTEFAAAYVRGMCPQLVPPADGSWLEAGRAAGLRLHRFKRTAGLPRVRRVLGVLKGFAPATVLDVGSGRGVFLWPLLETLEHTRVLAIDRLQGRVQDLRAVARGGLHRLQVGRMDVTHLALAARSMEVVTVLEVLEHLAAPARAAREALRVASRAVVASVPSRADDNPEHVRLFTVQTLRELFLDAGARSVRVDGVPGHMIAVAKP